MTDSFSEKLLAFANFLTKGNFKAAHKMLSAAEKEMYSSGDLKESFQEMFEGEEGLSLVVELINTMTDWPDRQDSDLGWAYVSISDDNYSEGISAVITREGNATKIRDIEWGRP
jgi:hypothetical protein